MSWERDPMSWERDKKKIHMSPQCCRRIATAHIVSKVFLVFACSDI